MKVKIGITIGDINGIGPEVILKTITSIDRKMSEPIIFAPKGVLPFYQDLLSLQSEFTIHEIGSDHKFDVQPGKQTSNAGLAAMLSIEAAISACLRDEIDAMVTAPISKEAVNLAGYTIPGHTEFLADKTKTDTVLMILVNEGLRVALATGHIPLSKVSSSISKELLLNRIGILSNSLRDDFQINDPRIAVLALNPHAGDGGVIGTEEIETIIPALKEAKTIFPGVEGPFPADGFFGQKLHTKFDAILAMYHDQGLAPFKLLSFGKGVNFTAGLPIIRTSPDHGTAFNIAGNGVADPSSFLEAYHLAVKLAYKRIHA